MFILTKPIVRRMPSPSFSELPRNVNDKWILSLIFLNYFDNDWNRWVTTCLFLFLFHHLIIITMGMSSWPRHWSAILLYTPIRENYKGNSQGRLSLYSRWSYWNNVTSGISRSSVSLKEVLLNLTGSNRGFIAYDLETIIVLVY